MDASVNSARPVAPLPRWQLALVFGALLGAVFFLRWPTFGISIWNVDEAIHAGVARTLLDGGVMYRDAIDQRTPLTYYAVAGIFRLAGENNLWAVRAFVAGLIAATAFGLFLLGRLWRGTGAGLWSALAYVAFSTSMLYPGDANAANTEWFVSFFVVWGAWLFWRGGPVPDFRRALAVGVVYSLAFLSKQPSLLDLGAPLGLLVFLAATRRAEWSPVRRTLLGVCAGYTATVAAVLGYFALKGALADFYFYAWTYNLVFYGPEVTLADRFATAVALPGLVGETYPLLLTVIGGALAAGLLRFLQLRPTPAEAAERPVHLFLGAWLLLATAGAASVGRVYAHYFIQTLAPLSLLAGLGLGALVDYARTAQSRFARFAALGAVAAAAAVLLWHPFTHGRKDSWHGDPAIPIADTVKALTKPDERIFVWGWNPDIYLYADRKPASRFLYCSFLTGLVPWTNLQPGRDTSYAIVPGTMDTLLDELERKRPAMIVDCSVGPHRNFQKYPLEKFPRLRAAIAQHYVEVEKQPFAQRGFRVFLLKDDSRLRPVPLEKGTPSQLEMISLHGPSAVEPIPADFEISGQDGAGRLQRLELLLDGNRLDGASFAPTRSVALTLSVPFHRISLGAHTLQVRATASDGATRESAPFTVQCGPLSLPAEQLRSFAVPHLAATLAPRSVQAPYGAQAREEAGRMVYFAHAPSVIAYPIEAKAETLRGFFALRPAAYAETNTGPTDGAEFIVDWIDRNGTRTNLFRRLINPREVATDRGEQPFSVRLPGREGVVELIASPGPAGNAASDWSYWSELLLTNSR